MILGVALCSWAGDLRDRMQKGAETRKKGSLFVRGILICFASGILSTLFNIALTYGKVILFLASDWARAITGQTINVDGGWHMH